MQTNLFTPHSDFQIHAKESNQESQAILEANRQRFSKNCKTLFEALYRGEVLNSIVVVQRYGIIDWRRRKCDLQANGVQMTSAPSPLGKGLKDWWMTFEDKQFNQKFI